MVLPNNPYQAATVDVTTSPKVQAQSSEPILKAGGGVAGVAALVVAIFYRLGVPVVEGERHVDYRRHYAYRDHDVVDRAELDGTSGQSRRRHSGCVRHRAIHAGYRVQLVVAYA